MSNEDEQKKDRSKISLRIGDVQIELEGNSDNIRKLMDEDLVNFTKGLEATKKQMPPSTEHAPRVNAKTKEVTPKISEAASIEKTVPPPQPSKPSITTKPPVKKSRFFSKEKKPEKTGKKRFGWKPVAVALLLVCIVLSAGLVGAFAVYLPMVENLESQVAERDSTISSLNSQVTSANAQLYLLQSNLDESGNTISNLQEQNGVLSSQIDYYLNILAMNVSGYFFVEEPLIGQNASEYTVIFQEIFEYAGYVAVSVESTSVTTYVELLWSYSPVTYDHNVTVGGSGVAYFPVLPGPIEIRIGNTDVYTGDLLNATVTAGYCY
jgi:uncharacterized coiled-coil protein SlyX